VKKEFLTTTHGLITCKGCHGGQDGTDPESAHKGLVKNPASSLWNNEGLKFGVCEKCHTEDAKVYANSLHYTQQGFVTTLENLAYKDVLNGDNPISQGYKLNCSNCHADCGECHVRNPRAVQGGLIAGHLFQKTTPVKTCYGCHGARNAGEFIGDVGPTADVHYYDHNMVCTDCHKKVNLHGNGEPAEDMHKVEGLPTCITKECHSDTMSPQKGIKMHLAHKDPNLLACSVCHSQEAHGCNGCHINYKDGTKAAVYSQSNPVDTFKIAKNPNPTLLHPEKYITVRHIPTSADLFVNMGYPKLEGFDNVSNWQISPTHNTQRNTPQASSCNSCHSIKKVFLTEEDILPTDSKAVEGMLVKDIPQVIKEEY
jgi:hypothetical protein